MRSVRTKKKKIREGLRRWREKESDKGKYKKIKNEYKELCKQKEKKKNERWENEVEQIRREEKV